MSPFYANRRGTNARNVAVDDSSDDESTARLGAFLRLRVDRVDV